MQKFYEHYLNISILLVYFSFVNKVALLIYSVVKRADEEECPTIEVLNHRDRKMENFSEDITQEFVVNIIHQDVTGIYYCCASQHL